LRPLLAKCLRALRIVPDVGLFEFALDFGQALGFALIVKDTSSAHRSALQGRLWFV
jgi:hypothetical protein